MRLSKGVISKYVKAAFDAALIPASKVVHTRGDCVLPDVLNLPRELRRKGMELQVLGGVHRRPS
ncbi:Mobile element protein [Pseudomonas chlororaphis subsp. aurantiaca]|nr:Mobile element protein [Pseudomonas chlororaphis subsp. aurantiaca]AZD62209.1 Mobile element protein [Pseudomonas chlororaphis subsp. aurantiaca]